MFCVCGCGCVLWSRNIQNLAIYSFFPLHVLEDSTPCGVSPRHPFSVPINDTMIGVHHLFMDAVCLTLSVTIQCLLSTRSVANWWWRQHLATSINWSPHFQNPVFLSQHLCVLLRGSWLFYNIRFVGLDSVQWDSSVCELLLYAHVSESLNYANDQTSDPGCNISEH